MISSPEDPAVKEATLDLIIGDLSSVENADEEEEQRKGMAGISEKNIVLPPMDEKGKALSPGFLPA